ncbi:hypothetical protein GCM10009609_00120 [Pseudonocardia aurantiaca]
MILRKERPHPGAQLRTTDADGMRLTGFLLGNQVELNRYLELAETLISTVAGVDEFCITNVMWHREQQRTRS